MVGTVMDIPNVEVVRHWVAWEPTCECEQDHDAERVEQFNRWLVQEIRHERDAERRGIMDLLEEMIQQATEGDDLEGLCLFREALWERNDK